MLINLIFCQKKKKKTPKSDSEEKNEDPEKVIFLFIDKIGNDSRKFNKYDDFTLLKSMKNLSSLLICAFTIKSKLIKNIFY